MLIKNYNISHNKSNKKNSNYFSKNYKINSKKVYFEKKNDSKNERCDRERRD